MNRITNLCLPVAIGAILLGQISTANGEPNRFGRGGGAPAAAHAAAPHMAAPRMAAPRMAAPRMAAPARVAPHFSAPRMATPHVAAPSGFAHRSFHTPNAVHTQRSFVARPNVARPTVNIGARTLAHRNLRNNITPRSTAARNNFVRGNRNLALKNRAGRTLAPIAQGPNLPRGRTARLNRQVTGPGTPGNPMGHNGVAANRAFARRNGAVAANRAFVGDPRRHIASNQFAFRAGNFHSGWNPGQTYFWHHHHWRCYNGVWAVADVGWPYDWYSYPYPFVYDNTVYYDGDVYGPGDQVEPIASNSVVADVQTDLAEQGYDPGPADGIPGPQTSQAVADYQQDHGLTPTGQIDSALLDSLGI